MKDYKCAIYLRLVCLCVSIYKIKETFEQSFLNFHNGEFYQNVSVNPDFLNWPKITGAWLEDLLPCLCAEGTGWENTRLIWLPWLHVEFLARPWNDVDEPLWPCPQPARHQTTTPRERYWYHLQGPRSGQRVMMVMLGIYLLICFLFQSLPRFISVRSLPFLEELNVELFGTIYTSKYRTACCVLRQFEGVCAFSVTDCEGISLRS
jgi:hypothetical protein